MYKILISTILLSSIIIGCQSPDKKVAETVVKQTIEYPEVMKKVFDAHGGLTQWNKMNAMSYDIVKEGGNEKQLIDLKSRNERIEAANFTMGYDGKDFWLEADSTYKGNPVFYKNLMFYFYAMPFVLADEGIIFSETPDLVHDGTTYPGLRVSYQEEIGVSPEDEYFIHYDAETFQMQWLGYTVTYFSKEKSTAVKWIKYDDWKTFSGLVLPQSMGWYNLENNLPTDEKSRRVFDNINVSATPFQSETFDKTEMAKVVEQ